jgi:hypothetical protein
MLLAATIALQGSERDLNFQPPAWVHQIPSKFGFTFARGLKYDRKPGYSEIRFTFRRKSSPASSASFHFEGRRFDDIRPGSGFGPDGVYAGLAVANSWLRKQPKFSLQLPIFGEDAVFAPCKNGFDLLQVAYYRYFRADFSDYVALQKPPRGVPTLNRDRTEDKAMFESFCRFALAHLTAENDLVAAPPVSIAGHSYASSAYRQVPTDFAVAMPNRPTTRWIKLSDWARNKDVTVTYGDMTAEYVYRGERYLLPLASDQFKKGTAWFKTSGPILMRGDDWLIPTAMVD